MLPPLVARRALCPLVMVLEAGLLGLFAGVTLIGLLLVPFDRRGRIIRAGAVGFVYMGVELTTLTALFGSWLIKWARSEEWWDETNRRLVTRALSLMLLAGRRLLGFVVTVDEAPQLYPLDQPEPVLVLARHGGLGDSIALIWILLDRYGRRPRVVLKAVLQWEPLLDVALNRFGACFLPGKEPDGGVPADRIGTLAAAIGPSDALLLFPEGANWTPRRRDRAIEGLRTRGKHRAAGAAALMPHLLPPRPAGVFACLDARPGLAVVMVAHTGLDKLTSAAMVWRAIPFDRPMRVRWWPGSPAPEDPDARLEWLTAEWAVVDEWIDVNRAAMDRLR